MSAVMAVNNWTTNAHMIESCVELGYLRSDWLTLDPTYERGTWWRRWRPDNLVTHHRANDGSDFRALPYLDCQFDAIAYDPPYVAKGGRSTSGITDMDERYGQVDCPATPALLQDLINDGLTEMYRLVKPGGFVLTKCKSYISSATYWPGVHLTTEHALRLGFDLHDQLIHLAKGAGPQPARTRKDGAPVRQHHARNNYSTLLILRRGRS